jgi:cytochrome b561
LVNRLLNPPPPLPVSLPRWQRMAAEGSHYQLYALMLSMPLIGTTWSLWLNSPTAEVLCGRCLLS